MDVIAGVTVGIIALALSMALGIASDRTPGVGYRHRDHRGLSQRHLQRLKGPVGGPTAAFIPVVVGVAQTYGVDGLVVCALLAGAILILMGIARLGVMIKYIPVPVIPRFTAGIAVYIFSTQARDFLRLRITGKIPTELCAQGAANIGSALFGGLPATGALARTAANIRSGARSPVAGITHSLTILTVVFVAAPLAGYIPLPVLSAVMVVVALNMGEWHHFIERRGSHFVMAGVHTQPFMALSKGGFVEQLGEENFCADMDSALARAAQLAA